MWGTHDGGEDGMAHSDGQLQQVHVDVATVKAYVNSVDIGEDGVYLVR